MLSNRSLRKQLWPLMPNIENTAMRQQKHIQGIVIHQELDRLRNEFDKDRMDFCD